MQLYVSAAQMKQIDRTAIDKYGVSASFLMESAGKAVAEEAAKLYESGTVLVVSGYGNNGGDGFVAARHLLKKNLDVEIFLAGRPRPFSNESGDNFKALLESGCAPVAIYEPAGMERAFAAVARCGIIIDALFGIGIKGPLDSFYVALINKINSAGAKIVSVDLPSGLDADTGTPCPSAVKAHKTITLGLPKNGFKNPASGAYTGDIMIADIGLPRPAVEDALNNTGYYAG